MTMIRRMLRWGCLCLGALLASQAWASECQLTDYGTLSVEMIGGLATAMVKINGHDTRFILDTGAFYNTMSHADALALGVRLHSASVGFRIRGVGGSAAAELGVVKAFGILGATLKDISFIVGGTDEGDGLLGANMLDAVDLDLDLAHGKVTLLQPEHCKKSALAYWATGRNYRVATIEPIINRNDRRTFVRVIINGKPMRALIDSGASATVLSRAAAERIGINLDAPGVKTGHVNIGIGSKVVKTWIVGIDSFSVGTETIRHSQMEVIDSNMGDSQTDMLLGVDFILAHHILIASSQGKIYFTYNGGRVFSFAKASNDSDKPADGSNDTAPKTAPDYALRGEADLSRGEPKAAVADLDTAIHMAPGQAAYYLDRARAYASEKQPRAALADLDTSLSLDPKSVDALLMRAEQRLAQKDRAGAVVDVTAAKALVPAGSTQAGLIASLYIQLDQPATALPLLDEWIRLHGDDAMLGDALNSRCWARSLSNQMLDQALSDCKKAISLDGKDPDYLDSLGMVQLRLGHYAESIKAYRQAVAQMPHSAWTRYGLGLAEIRSGQVDNGNADLVAARALDPKIDAEVSKYGLTATVP